MRRTIVLMAGVFGCLVFLFKCNESDNSDAPVGLPFAKDADSISNFAATAFYDIQGFWENYFAVHKLEYRRPKLMIAKPKIYDDPAKGWYERIDTLSSIQRLNYNGIDHSFNDALIEPHYEMLGSKVFLNTFFFIGILQLNQTPDAKFTICMTIAHEIGHHVQHMLGIRNMNLKKVRNSSSWIGEYLSQISKDNKEDMSDIYAGIWARYEVEQQKQEKAIVKMDRLRLQAQHFFDALAAVSAPGDSLHGIANERVKYFWTGYNCANVDSLLQVSKSRTK